jgi:transcriptional regulator with XRE-family HTH domain
MTSPETDGNPAKRLGRKLREARLAAGYRSQEAFGSAVNLHRTTVTKIENGDRHVTVDVLKRWCEVCSTDFELYEASARLAWVTEVGPVPVWFEDFYKAQVLAHTIRSWHPVIVPGLLQTPEYATALHEGAGTPDDLISDRVTARMDLQQKTIERRPVPVDLLVVVDEAVLHRQVGPPEVMRGQLLHLVEQGRRKHIGVQVVPASRGANAGHVGAFTVASLDDGDVMLMDAIEDITTDKRPAVRTALGIYDRVRLVAMSGPESLELIQKVAEEWNP